jgi:hypothetical protein
MRMVHAVSRWSEGRRRDRPRKGFRVTARDEEIVRWIGRLRMATAAQVAARFGLGRAVTYARLGGLLQLGLLEHVRIFHGEPGVYCATRPGLSVTGLELPPARIDIRSYAHDVYLSALVIDLEREFRPEQITTEREMRAMDTSSHQTPTGRSASGSNLRERMASSSSHPPVGHCCTSLTVPRWTLPTQAWTRCSRWNLSGQPKGVGGCGGSSPATSRRDILGRCATTQSVNASDVSSRARWQRSAPMP